MPEVPDGEADMTARLTIVRTQPIEPMRVEQPRYASDAAIIALWIAIAFGLIAFWATVFHLVKGLFS